MFTSLILAGALMGQCADGTCFVPMRPATVVVRTKTVVNAPVIVWEKPVVDAPHVVDAPIRRVLVAPVRVLRPVQTVRRTTIGVVRVVAPPYPVLRRTFCPRCGG